VCEAEVELGVEVVGVVKDTTAAELDETTEEEVVDCTDVICMGVNEPRDHILIVRLRQADRKVLASLGLKAKFMI
jgi:hypothetical protein